MAGVWRGVMIEGPSGSGKSDLALRALSHGLPAGGRRPGGGLGLRGPALRARAGHPGRASWKCAGWTWSRCRAAAPVRGRPGGASRDARTHPGPRNRNDPWSRSSTSGGNSVREPRRLRNLAARCRPLTQRTRGVSSSARALLRRRHGWGYPWIFGHDRPRDRHAWPPRARVCVRHGTRGRPASRRGGHLHRP